MGFGWGEVGRIRRVGFEDIRSYVVYEGLFVVVM